MAAGVAVVLLLLASLVFCYGAALGPLSARHWRPKKGPLEGLVRILHASDEESAQVAGAVAGELKALGCTVADAADIAGVFGAESVDLVLAVLTPTLLAVDTVRAELVVFKELGVAVIPVHSGDQFPRDELTPMISCGAAELLGREAVERSEEADVLAARKYLFAENIRDVRNESNAEACRTTLHQLALRAGQVHSCRAEGVPGGHYKHDVFISYHAKDAWDVYESVAAVFEGFDLDVFNPSKDLQMTQVSLSEMVRHVKGSGCVLQILTPNYPLSKWCRAELFAAEQEGISTYVVYASKKHTRARLMEMLSAPAEPGSPDEEAVNSAKASIRRAAELHGVTDVYNPDFADGAAERMQAIALKAIPRMRRRLAVQHVLGWLLAILMMMALGSVYVQLTSDYMDFYCAKRDIRKLRRALLFRPESPTSATKCLDELDLNNKLANISNKEDVSDATEEILHLADAHRGDWDMMLSVLSTVDDMIQRDPVSVAGNAGAVHALVEIAREAMEGHVDNVDPSPDGRKEALKKALDVLIVLAQADTDGNVLDQLPALMPSLLQQYWKDFDVARRAVELAYGLSRYISENDLTPNVEVADFLPELLRVMQQHPARSELQEHGAYLLRAYAANTSKGDVPVTNITKVLADALRSHEARVAVRNRVVLALEAFSRNTSGAAAICGAQAVKTGVEALARATGRTLQPTFALSVMRIVNATATVSNCWHQANRTLMVAAFNSSLRLGLKKKDLAMLALTALGRLAEDDSSRRDILNVTLAVVLQVSGHWVLDLDVSCAAAALLSKSADKLRDTADPQQQDGVVKTLLWLLNFHLDKSSQGAAPLLASAVAVVSAMSAGSESHASNVSQYLFRGLNEKSTSEAAEMVLKSLNSSAEGMVGFLFKRLLSPNNTQLSAAIRVVGNLSSKFPSHLCNNLNGIMLIMHKSDTVHEAATWAVSIISADNATFARAMECIRNAIAKAITNRSYPRAAVNSLVAIGKYALKHRQSSGQQWEVVDAELRELAASLNYELWASLQSLAPVLPDDALIPWLKLALQNSLDTTSFADQIAEALVRPGKCPLRRMEAARVLCTYFTDKNNNTLARTLAVRCWGTVANGTEVEVQLQQVLRMVEGDKDPGVQVTASRSAVEVLSRVSPQLCKHAVGVVHGFLCRNEDTDHRMSVMEAFKRPQGVLPPGECRDRVMELLRARKANDTSTKVQKLAGEILRSYCPTTLTGCTEG